MARYNKTSMKSFLSLSLGLALISVPGRAPATTPAPAKVPSFECTDGEGSVFKVWIGTGQNRMRVTENKKEREILLSGANVNRPAARPDDGLRYNGWNAAGSDLFTLLDAGQEFSVTYLVTDGSTRARVAIVVDNRERLGLSCKATGVAVRVVSEDSEWPAPQRYGASIDEVVGLRTRKGTLEPIGVMRLEAVIRRMSFSSDAKKPAVYKAIVDRIGPSLKTVDPRTVRQISIRLKGPVADLWNKILDDVQFKYYPEASRLAAWVKEGARPEGDRHIPSIIAGFNNFAASPGFKDKDIKAFFISEVSDSLKEIDDAAALKLNAYFTREARAFFETIWSRANNKKTLTDFPELAANVIALSGLLVAKDFDPLQVHNQIQLSLKLLERYGPESKVLYLNALSAPFKGLNARRQEDLKGWIEEPPEKALISELLSH